jgi:hypothetical protein
MKKTKEIARLTVVRRDVPLTETEQAFLDAYMACGDAETACKALGIPVANGPILLSKPAIKRMFETAIGYRPSVDMDAPALLEEVLTVARDAVREKSHMAALKGYQLFHFIKQSSPQVETIDTSETERQELQRRAKAVR